MIASPEPKSRPPDAGFTPIRRISVGSRADASGRLGTPVDGTKISVRLDQPVQYSVLNPHIMIRDSAGKVLTKMPPKAVKWFRSRRFRCCGYLHCPHFKNDDPNCAGSSDTRKSVAFAALEGSALPASLKLYCTMPCLKRSWPMLSTLLQNKPASRTASTQLQGRDWADCVDELLAPPGPVPNPTSSDWEEISSNKYVFGNCVQIIGVRPLVSKNCRLDRSRCV